MSDRAKTSARAPSGGGDDTSRGAGPDEFAHIPTPRTRHPVLAVAAALLSAYLVVHVRHELRYALSSGAPLDLGDASVTFSPRTTTSGLDNRYVRVAGTPDRESGLEVDTKGSWTFSQFFRVLGTGDRLFVHRRESPLPGPRAEADVFEGRLVRFSELPFEESVRRYFSAHVVATHFFAVDELRRSLQGAAAAGQTLSLRDRAGDLVRLAPDDLVVLDVRLPDEVRVSLPRERFLDEASARAEIERRGGAIVSSKGLVKVEAAPSPGAMALSSGPPPVERWTFVARFSGPGRDAALGALGELDRKVELREAREAVKVRVADLAGAPEGLAVAGRPLALASIAAARTLATVKVPDDAYLLIEGDQPREHLPTLFLALAVAMFGVFNLAALVRGLRR